MRNPSKDFELLRPFIIRKKFDDWRDQIVCWYNEWRTKPYENKRKKLLIKGEPNSGKTCFIKALMHYFIHQCFTPFSCSYKYAWSGFDEFSHSHVIFDEATFKNWSEEQLKLVLEGESFVCDKKHASAEKKSCNIPMISISNEEPKSFTGLEERIFKVFVEKSYHVNNINDFLEFDWSIPEDELPLRPGQRPVFLMDYVKKITQPSSLVESLPQFDFNQPITPLSCLSEGWVLFLIGERYNAVLLELLSDPVALLTAVYEHEFQADGFDVIIANHLGISRSVSFCLAPPIKVVCANLFGKRVKLRIQVLHNFLCHINGAVETERVQLAVCGHVSGTNGSW
ncbi:hypothetical protein BpHYR1_001343 [Brachionus plicatilis]|uniref:Uncharacterized protein n=1 Tax=Brachionus plicatilis TaxID=10195 RepID=A0A3M7RJA5_BRAPC|nr:hypothetical protein BpHYR1_001343 [Brachionus plicatilis]